MYLKITAKHLRSLSDIRFDDFCGTVLLLIYYDTYFQREIQTEYFQKYILQLAYLIAIH